VVTQHQKETKRKDKQENDPHNNPSQLTAGRWWGRSRKLMIRPDD
jgi:hypothetical protein